MVLRVNTLEGGTNNTVLTGGAGGNSGGASGNFFDVIATNTPATEPAFSTTQAAEGVLGMRVAVTAADFCLGRWSALGDMPFAFGRCYVYFTANPGAITTVASTQTTAGGQLGRVRVLTTGLVRLANSVGTTIVDSTTAVNLNAWTRLEWRYRTSPSDFYCRISATAPFGAHDEEFGGAMDVTTAYGRQEYGVSQVLGASSVTFYMDGLVAGALDWPGTETRFDLLPPYKSKFIYIRKNK
jgi:hypothetical protein